MCVFIFPIVYYVERMMMNAIITGIQQVGIGVTDVDEAWRWYRKHFGMNVPIFQDSAEAQFMTRYTGDTVHARHAVLAMNLRGGGGFEIWQFTSRTPEPVPFEIKIGDLGITSVTLKTSDVSALFERHRSEGITVSDVIRSNPTGTPTYYVRDVYGNLFQIIESHDFFARTAHACGGVSGVSIGVRDIDEAKKLYANVLGYSTVEYDREGVFEDLQGLGGGSAKVRRALLRQSRPGLGSFGRLFGLTTVELISTSDREPRRIYENRMWGDCGFIHVCFDVKHMDVLKELSKSNGFPFTVDSDGSFDMGEATGRFSYTEDPDGTLIEFVETFKMPILAKLKLYLDLRKRRPEKPLPNWMLKVLKFTRVK